MSNTKTYHSKMIQTPKIIAFFLISTLLITNATAQTTVLNTSVCKDTANFSFSGVAADGFSIDKDPWTLDSGKITATSTSSIKRFSSNCHVIQMGSKDNEISLGTSAREIQFEYNASGASNYDKIVLVVQYKMEGSSTNDVSDVFTAYKRLFQEKATDGGYLGYIADNTLFILLPTSVGSFNLDGTETCPAESTISGENNIIRRNCLIGGTDLSEYFVNQASYSVGTWMLAGLICFFFILLLGSNDEMNMDNGSLRNNPMTLHPLYSLWMVGTDQFTKGSRYAQMTVSLSIVYLISGIITADTIDNNSYDFVIVLFTSAITGLIIAWIVTYITGCLLRRARNVDRDFLRKINDNFSGSGLRDLREQYERDSFVRYYEFYTICGIIVLATVIGIYIIFLILSQHGFALWSRRGKINGSIICDFDGFWF